MFETQDHREVSVVADDSVYLAHSLDEDIEFVVDDELAHRVEVGEDA
ncbi:MULTISPECIES: hypothetical protein [unclassified Mycolicibacterium]